MKDETFLIRGGQIFDGTGSSPIAGDLLISNGIIQKMGAGLPIPSPETRIFEAKGFAIVPGFIDVHTHSDFGHCVPEDPANRIFQGVTTEVCGNCGFSAFPRGQFNGDFFRREWDYHRLPANVEWDDFEGYLEFFDHHPPGINIIPLLGHGTLREAFNGSAEKLAPGVMARMGDSLRRDLKMGLFGFSTGLIYVPGCYAPPEEIADLAKVAGPFGAIYTTHMRSEGEHLVESIEESIKIAESTGLRLQISHLKTSGGKRNWPKITPALEAIEAARERGTALAVDRYPYTRSETFLKVMLPNRFFANGEEAAREELRSPATRQRLKAEIESTHPGENYYRRIFLGDIPSGDHPDFFGQCVVDLAEREGLDPFEFCCDLLVHQKFQVDAFFEGMCEENMIRIFEKPYTMVGSDSFLGSRAGVNAARKPHPRGWGTFNLFFRMVREGHVSITLPEAVRRVSGLPADHFHISRRGYLREGYHADVGLVDFGTMAEGNSFSNPKGIGAGVKALWVNGTLVMDGGETTGKRGGMVLRRG